MKSVLFLSFLCISAFGKAQSSHDSSTRIFYWGVGYQYQSFGNLSSRIGTRPEYQKPGSSFSEIIAGTSKERKHLIADVSIHFANNITGDDEKRNTQMRNFGISALLGYNFSKSRNFRFYPFIGITGETYRAKFSKDVSAISFDSILISNTVQQRTEPLIFNTDFFCYKGGLAVDFLRYRNQFLGSIGLRASYTGSFKSRSWRVNENQLISGAPTDGVSQFNASLVLGLGHKGRGMRMM